jgi:hypothetical protein
VLTFLGAFHRVARDILARVHRGMIRHAKGFLCAIDGFYGHGLRTLVHIFHRTRSRMDGFIAEPFDRMSRLLPGFSDRMDDHMAALFAGEVNSFGCILEAVHSGLLSELDRFDRAVGGLYYDGFRARVYFFDCSGNDVCRCLCRLESCGTKYRDQLTAFYSIFVLDLKVVKWQSERAPTEMVKADAAT